MYFKVAGGKGGLDHYYGDDRYNLSTDAMTTMEFPVMFLFHGAPLFSAPEGKGGLNPWYIRSIPMYRAIGHTCSILSFHR